MAIKCIADVKGVILQDPTKVKFHPSPAAWEDQLLYFLLPDRFSDGNEKAYKDVNGNLVRSGSIKKYQDSDASNAVRNEDDARIWREAGGNFVGGTLKGLKSKLGYLKRLGVTAVWVGPIFKQVAKLNTYHGYGIQDFLDVDPRFGTREELKEFVEAAHDQGIYVLLDIILNHSGNVFEYVANNPTYTGETFDVRGFCDADRRPVLSMTPVSEDNYPDGAIWPQDLQHPECFTRKGQIDGDHGGWVNWPQYLLGDFFDLKDLALGPDEPNDFTATRALRVLVEVYKYWIAYADIDGYRIDTVKHMGKGPTRYFASEIHEYAQYLGKDNFYLLGEIAGDAAYETVGVTGLDAALGIGDVQSKLWRVPKGQTNPSEYFDLFRDALYLKKGSHTWFRDKIVTMIDDHDQIWRGNSKARFCAEGDGGKLIGAALMFNLCTLGIPCIYYGTEQGFDGSGGADTYIREAMFGGEFGPFRSKNHHCFDEDNLVYKQVGEVVQLRRKYMALRRGKQYLREISGDGYNYGYPFQIGSGPIQTIIAWSRIFNSEEYICAISTDPVNEIDAWVTVDCLINPEGAEMRYLYPANGGVVQVQDRNGRSVIELKNVPAGGFVILGPA